jgi:sulfur carrier protein ThiS
MSNWLALSLTLFLLADADVPRVNSLRPPASPAPNCPAEGEIPLFPSAGATSDNAQSQNQSQSKTASSAKNTTLQEGSKLELIRYVSGEFAKAVKPLPAGKEGFHVTVGKPLETEHLDRAVATHGAAINTGDNVQITKLEFRDHQIVVDVNGGGRGKRHWRDHIQIGIGGGYPTMQSTSTQDQGPPGMQPGMGSTIFLEFNKQLPDLTPDELKQLLSPFLNFAKERSAAVQWFDTLPPEMKKAIQDRRPVVGMDREELVAAIGKPDHKVRERDSEGNDIEDWIYGQPPSKTVFIRFQGERVTSIKQFPQ